jgi:hypothetical protein
LKLFTSKHCGKLSFLTTLSIGFYPPESEYVENVFKAFDVNVSDRFALV